MNRLILTSISQYTLLTVLLLSVSLSTFARPGITEGDHVVVKLNNTKKRVYLFGDTHNKGTLEENDQQVVDFVGALKETSADRNGSMHILWEKAGSYHRIVNDKFLDGTKTMLLNVESEIARQGAESVSIKDEEIRKIAISANHILKRGWQDGESYENFKLYDEVEQYVGSLTFGDIEKAYQTSLEEVEEFYNREKNTYNLEKAYFLAIEYAKDFYGRLQDLMRNHGITKKTNIAAFAFDCWKNKKMSKNIFGKECYLHQIFGEQVTKVFSPLFDAYLLKRICETRENHIGIVAGAGHTRNIIQMLLDQKGDRIIYEKTRFGILSKSYFAGILRGYSLSNKIRTELELFLFKSLIISFSTVGKMRDISIKTVAAARTLCGGLDPSESPKS